MKKYLSVFMIASKETLYKVLGVMILMGVAQVAVFSLSLKAVEIIWMIAFVLVIAILDTSGISKKGGAVSRYTVQRLEIQEWKQVACQAVYNMAIFIIFWAFSVGIALLICHLDFSQADPDSYGSQGIFLMFYRNDLFHSLLPLADGLRYVRNVFMFLALAVAAAVEVFWKRRGKRMGYGLLGSLYWALMFVQPMGSSFSNLLWIAASVAFIGLAVYFMISRLKEGEQE